MAFVTIPKDLNNIKTKFLGPFTKRQCIFFGSGILCALPVYFGVKAATNTTIGFYALLAILFPFFIMAMMEKDGLPMEIYIKNWILHKIRPQIRLNKCFNIYSFYAVNGKKLRRKKRNGKKHTTGITKATDQKARQG